MTTRQQVAIRPLVTWQEMTALTELQQETWGGYPAYILHPDMLVSIAMNGGAVLGALAGEQLVGGAVALLGAASDDEDRPAMANLKLASERLIVHEAYRNQGIGFQLKLAQYQFAAKRGIRLMTWVFDPLHGPSAHLAVRRLGAVVTQYFPAFYPAYMDVSSYPGSADRMRVDWWLTGGRALERLKKNGRSPLTLDQYLDGGTRILNPSTFSEHGGPVPSDSVIQPESALALIEVPDQVELLLDSDPALVTGWRDHTRAIFTSVLDQGFVLTDYVRGLHQGWKRSFYVCSHEGVLRQFDRKFNQN